MAKSALPTGTQDFVWQLKDLLGLNKPLVSPVAQDYHGNVNSKYVIDKSTPASSPETLGASASSDYSSPVPDFVPAGNRKPTIPNDYLRLINESSQKYGVPAALMTALIHHESAGTWDPQIKGPSGDYGLAQIVLSQHPDITLQQAYDPTFAIPFVAKYLANSYKKFGDYNRALAAYNVGMGGANVRGDTPAGTGPRGQEYINRVANNLSQKLREQLGIKTSR